MDRPVPTMIERMRGVFTLDSRALAAFRIGLGTLLLADLATRARDFAAMYAEGGIAPPELVRSQLGPGEWSLHLLSGSTTYQAALFALAAGLAAALATGYRTRWATIGSWLLLASLHVRLPTVLNAGDTLLRVLLFWGMFLPLGAVWSVDGWRSAARRRGDSEDGVRGVCTAATVALIGQLALVYWCAVIGKLNEAWLGGDALSQILGFGIYALPAGRWLAEFPAVTRLLSWSVIALELLGPLLLLSPWQTRRLRVIAVVAFVAFHLGIAATVTVGLFAWVGVVAWIAMMPGRAGGSPVAVQGEPERHARAAWRVWQSAAVAALASVVVLWNMADLANVRLPWLRPVANVTMLRQSWQLFSTPDRFDAWFVYRGRLASGASVDLLRGVPLAADGESSNAGQQFANHRWRKLHVRLLSPRWAAYRQPLADYVLRSWNDRHAGDEHATRLDLVSIRRPVDRTDGMVRVNLARVVLDATEGAFADALRESGL